MKRKTDNFSKFFEKKKKNGAIKEAFKQEKRAVKKERKDAIERHFEEKRQARAERFGAGAPERPTDRSRPPQNAKPGERPAIPEKGQAAPNRKVFATKQKPAPQPNLQKKPTPVQPPNPSKAAARAPGAKPLSPHTGTGPDLIPLNKYIAHGGICSRRDAAELIRKGKVEVNGQPVTEPGTRASPADLVKVNGKKITMSRNFAYILLNKPKDYITTTDDPLGRKTVLDLIRQATPERVYPIGRLDRNTSGVLLLTNDGDLAQKLAHPSHEVKKIYHVTLDKVLTKADFDKIVQGVTLDDGPAMVDVIAYADAKDRSQIGLEIHSGRNRIVRRIFEHLGYDVRGLDRVMYAGLTKKNVQRGKWRLLTEKEIRILKYLNSGVRTIAPAGKRQDKDTPPVRNASPARNASRPRNASSARGASAGKDASSLKGASSLKDASSTSPAARAEPVRPDKSGSTGSTGKPSSKKVPFNSSYRPRPSRNAD